ncbi:CBS domain-containing protein [Salipaludibacillus daqingensis]|uniref:CBS domain-containing protein n=1 Tax=Salipaludibacillus daqingensis TaxID=3041001 RepID=UPI0024731283|nr:CBS domain-containing protein [Salipaludibacillus daqingensis]
MQIILSHTNLDFDGLASMIAAKKIYPLAEIVLPSKLSPEVEHFLAIYKDTFPFQRKKNIRFDRVREVILVDASDPKRTGDFNECLPKSISYIVYDHHPATDGTVYFSEGTIESVGATITLLAEKLMEQKITISPFEATVFSLGVYSDTGAFTYPHTTARDLQAGAYFMEQGANLLVVDQFREAPLKEDQQKLYQQLLDNSDLISIDGIDICIATHAQKQYTGHLASVTRKLLQITGADVVFSIAEMGHKTFITVRATSDRVNVLPLIYSLDGGGHEKAAAAVVRNQTSEDIYKIVKKNLPQIVKPSLIAKDMMSCPVRVIAPQTTIETASKMLYRYGHTGFPVVEDDKLIGIISRRDVDKALHHQLGHAPVKGYMSHQPITIGLNEKIEQIRELMIEDRVGRLPVVENGQLVGIVSRTDVIQAMHGKKGVNITFSPSSAAPLKRQLIQTMRRHLSPTIYQLLEIIGEEAGNLSMRAYLIGGMVRDLLLEKENEDMDIVVEGDGISLALHLQNIYGGKVRKHDEFRTATWKHPSGFKVDLTSARTEYYDFPAALPKVEMSTIKEDLFRRDFTINAMGICLHKDEFGELIDYFHGFEDLRKGKLRVLYNLSFVEDPTRILRAIRFESRFQFRMDAQTERLATQSANNLQSVSKPRLSSELVRLFYEEDPSYGVERIQELSLTKFMIPTPTSEREAKEHVKLLHTWHKKFVTEKITVNRSIWICYWFILTSKKVKEQTSIQRYCLTKEDLKTLHALEALVLNRNNYSFENISKTKLHEMFASYQLEPLVSFFTILKMKDKKHLFHYLLEREKLDRKLAGDDLIEIGLTPSPLFREILFYGETVQLEFPSITKEELLEKVKTTFYL